jgi:anaerobic dimethyl sulfoxide reductase subunit C (anchor subunit)
MHNWSLIGFTLLVQGGIGLTWLILLSGWLGPEEQALAAIWPLGSALLLVAGGLASAAAHLGRPRLAAHALRNLGASWLSREVAVVQLFAGCLMALIVLGLLDLRGGLWILEAAACLLGGLAILAMTRVYLLKTVPTWNTVATPLEFVGSALLLGGGLGGLALALADHEQPFVIAQWIMGGAGVGCGLLLKLAALMMTLDKGSSNHAPTWYAPADMPLSKGRCVALRMMLNLAGLAFMLWAGSGSGMPVLLACFALICFAAGEVLGRWRFYQAYARAGL